MRTGYNGNNVTSDIAIRKALNTARTGAIRWNLQRLRNGIHYGPERCHLTSTVLASEHGDAEAARFCRGGWVDADGDGIVEKNGVKAEFDLLYVNGTYRQELGLEFVRVAAEIGIKVNLRLTTWDTILPDIHQHAVLYGFGSGDPSELYNLYYGGIAGGTVPWNNSGCYKNELADAAIDAALNAYDESEALPYWKELQKYASARGDAPYCWLANANHVYMAAEVSPLEACGAASRRARSSTMSRVALALMLY